MKRPLADRLSDIALFFIRPIVVFFMKREVNVVHTGPTIKRSHEPFILISNHFNTWDAFVVMANVKKSIRFVATEVAYLDWSKKIGMRYLARTIKKRVGRNEYKAAKKIFTSLAQGYAVGLFPEGDNTYYGETVDIFRSTGKLLQRANVDVLLIKQQGGYLSQPRWADYFAKQGVVHTHTSTLFTKEELQDLSVEEINHRVELAIYNNDYAFQREQMIDFRRKHRAEGIERLMYWCNSCGGILTVHGHDHNIICDTCGVIGTINEYEFIEGNLHDNLVDYNHEQYTYMEEVIASTFSFPVTLNLVHQTKLRNRKLGHFTLTYKEKMLYLDNDTDHYEFDLMTMRYPVNTMRHSFSFDYGDAYYNFTDIRHQFVLYEMWRFLHGSYKEK
jgi:1-acyl-sn-glycerol-3-phosphate acyltransferase